MRHSRSILIRVLAFGLGMAAAEPAWPQGEPARGAPSGGPLDPDFERTLHEIEQRAADIKDLRATFVQRKHTALLRKPLESRGRVVMKDGRTRWETLDPDRSVMTTEPGSLSIYYPDRRVLEVYPLGRHVGEFSGSPIPYIAELRASFDIVRIEPFGAGDTSDHGSILALQLTPRAAPLTEQIAHVRVLIDTAVPCARRIDIEDVDGERTEIEFHDLAVNPGVDDDEVTFEPPAGTSVVHPLGDHADESGPRK